MKSEVLLPYMIGVPKYDVIYVCVCVCVCVCNL